MKLHDLSPTPGSRKARHRVGRGDSSGWGRTSGRGEKGAGSRSGSKYRPYFEGGQIPFFRRLPKRGFKSFDRVVYNLVNTSTLETYFNDGDVVDEVALRAKALLPAKKVLLKVLANGDLSKKLTVKANKFSAAAKAKIESAGGVCEIV